MLFSSLPMDIIHNILSYNESLKLRNGIYMDQIPKMDYRYKSKMPRSSFDACYKLCGADHFSFTILNSVSDSGPGTSLRFVPSLTLKNKVFLFRVTMNSLTGPIKYEYYFRGRETGTYPVYYLLE